MFNADILIQKMMVFYNVFTISELANVIGVSQPSISGWKRNNYTKAIANKCRELGIYNEIFGDLNSNINNFQNSKFNSSIAVNNGGNTNINSKSDEMECDDFTKSFFKELCKIYKNDKKKLDSILFNLIQDAKSN